MALQVNDPMFVAFMRDVNAIYEQRGRETVLADNKLRLMENLAEAILHVEPKMERARLFRLAEYLIRCGAVSSFDAAEHRERMASMETKILSLEGRLRAAEAKVFPADRQELGDE